MLAGLRHDAVIGGDHQQHEIDAGRAGQHVVHELLVARHVDEADDLPIGARPVGEAEIDGDAARLLLRQAIGIDAGQRAHQRGLAVIDMARGADDHAAPSAESGNPTRCSASRLCAGVQAARAAGRNGAASLLPPCCARSSQASAATASRATPAPI